MSVRAQTHKLGRKRDQRKALLKSLAESLIENESIVTTDAKARALRPHVEKLVTKARIDSNSQRRLVRARVQTDAATTKLFEKLAPRYAQRPGGYTRLEAAGYRRGDNAKMTRISFVIEPDEIAAGAEQTTTTESSSTKVETDTDKAEVATDEKTEEKSA